VTAERDSRHLVLKAAVGLAILFLWFPLVLIVLYAFTTDDVVPTFPPPGLTTKWFGIARDNPEIWDAMWLSVRVALLATDPSLESVFRIAAKYDVPVMIHCGDTFARDAKVRMAHPLLVDDVAVDYPDVRFVICHLGNPWFQDTAEVLYKNDNVFGDMSGLILGEFTHEFERHLVTRLKEMIAYMGDPGSQLMYGSDWPLVAMGPYVKFLHSLDFTGETFENIAWRTAAKLFRIDVEALQAK
jgi:predicted TIM-barrel fold metal-dependent hydrolase